MILALVNHKGGVGKTTTACNLAAVMAEKRRRVLLVDLDAQASASLSLGLGRGDLAPSVADCLFGGLPAARAVRATGTDRLDVLPAAPDLVNADLVLADTPGREHRLANVLASVRTRYDFVILDAPPNLGVLTVGALVAAAVYLVPVTPHYLALEALVNLEAATERMRGGMGRVAALLGVVLTQVRRTRAAAEVTEQLQGHYGPLMFKAEIPLNVRCAEAPSHGLPVVLYDRRAASAQAYRQLAAEVLRRCKTFGKGEHG